eukprot:TRINITY_DN7476_c0_g1_i6.p1 TRINITY_DN7476_c0_g1~~TRINITY_DN7476_c0_g1_i6.p1  ORF type:complete len:359 (-),score=19.84 TRINITY_DN7476_c0_g1_i6:112-1116(-)
MGLLSVTTVLLNCLVVLSNANVQDMEPTCPDRFQYYPTKIYSGTAKLISDLQYRYDTLGFEGASIYSKYVFFVNGTKPNQKFVLCTMPKAGASRAYMLMLKVIRKYYRGIYKDSIYNKDNYQSLWQLPLETIENILQDDSIPKIAFVRNPYIRVISMYVDKVAVEDSRYLEDLELAENEVSFDNFVATLHHHRSRSGKGMLNHGFLDRHFVSQTQLSLIPFGMDYNYIVKVEEINDWYDCFIDLVNIREEMMHGWPRKGQCYYSSPRAPCKGPRLVNGTFVNFDSGARHNHGSVNFMEQYYQNTTTLRMVTEMYQEDLIRFNYTIAENVTQFDA